jgi:acyl-CoA synthetase (AMP-forming)/AMP-acid ligase II
MAYQSGTRDSQTVIQRLNRVVGQQPDSLAVICTHQPANLYGFCSTGLDEKKYRQKPYLRWTFSTLSNANKCLAAGLQANGVKRGTPIFVFCQNQVEFILSTLVAYQLELIHVPMKSETLSNLEEAQHIVNAVIQYEQPTQVAVLTDNESAAKKVDELDLSLPALKILVEGNGASHGEWKPFASLLEGQKPAMSEPCDQRQSFKERAVFFTSGSTGLPKGCSIEVARWFEVLEPSLGLGSASPGDVLAVTVPSTHAFGYICTTMCLLRGACVLFPSPKYLPQETVEAIHLEKCTMAAMVSTMVYSLAEVYNASKQQMPLNLKKVTFAGMATTPDILKICRDTFGISAVENFFGMTEGVFTTTGFVQDLDTIIKGNDVSIGRPVAKSNIRICSPDDNHPLPAGTYGELHCSGYSTIHQYIGRRSDDFYEADGQIWFKTGDRGFIDHDSQLYIVGRYKDMIVRGGLNISPSKIEAVLTQHSEFRDLEPQIVAASNPTAGEIPFVVTRREIDKELIKRLQDTVRTSLGVMYVPNGAVSLQALGLDDYPRTAVGKIKKTKLIEKVREHQKQSQTPVDIEKPDSLPQLVQVAKATWARVLGIQDAEFDISTPVAQLADSITNLSARDRIQKATGKNVPLPEWTAATTFQDQIALLERSESEQEPINKSLPEKRMGPPRLEDMVHLDGDEDNLTATKTAVEKTIAKNCLSWDDIEDVFPCTDFMQILCRSRVINTWNIRTSIVSQNASIQVSCADRPVNICYLT